MYFTNYQVFNKEGVVLFSNKNDSCFAEYNVGKVINDKEKGFAEDRYMEIYIPTSLVKIDQKVIDFWCEELTKIGLPITHKLVTYTKEDKNLPVKLTKRELTHVYTVDFNNYKAKIQLILCCHLMRFMYEANMPNVITKAYELKLEQPEESGFDLFVFACTFVSGGGHGFLYTGRLHKFLKQDELNQQYNLWAKSKAINGDELSKFKALFQINDPVYVIKASWDTNPGIMLRHHPEVTIKTSLSEYKEIIKKYSKNDKILEK